MVGEAVSVAYRIHDTDIRTCKQAHSLTYAHLFTKVKATHALTDKGIHRLTSHAYIDTPMQFYSERQLKKIARNIISICVI